MDEINEKGSISNYVNDKIKTKKVINIFFIKVPFTRFTSKSQNLLLPFYH